MDKKWIATFKRVENFSSNLYCVQRNDGRFVVIDDFGKEKFVLPPDVAIADDFSDGVFRVIYKSGTEVYMDENAKVVLELPAAIMGYKFVKGIARVLHLDTRRYGYINKEGKEIITLPSSVKMAEDFSDDLALIEKYKDAVKPGKSKFSYIDEIGKTAIELTEDVWLARSFRNGTAILKHITHDDTWTDLIDTTGKPVDEPNKDSAEKPLYFPEYINENEYALKDKDGLYMIDPSDKHNYLDAIAEDQRYISKVPEDLLKDTEFESSQQFDFFDFINSDASIDRTK